MSWLDAGARQGGWKAQSIARRATQQSGTFDIQATSTTALPIATVNSQGKTLLNRDFGWDPVGKKLIFSNGCYIDVSGNVSGGFGFYTGYDNRIMLWMRDSLFQFNSSTKSITWSDSITAWAGAVTNGIYLEANYVTAFKVGLNANALRVYNTSADASNYERGGFDWITTSNTLRIRSENAGTGTNRLIAIDGFTKAGAAVAGDFPTGGWGLVHDSSGATTKLCYNDAGTIRTVALV